MRTNSFFFDMMWVVGRARVLITFGAAVMVALSLALLLAAEPARSAPKTFVVNSTADPGTGDCNATECTLREAINAANSNSGADTINFAIPGSGVHTISPGTSLPDITEAVTIDGYTQPGASKNTKTIGDNADLRIRLDGDYPQKTLAGLRFLADDSVVRGLSITRFFTALVILDTDNNKIQGNFVGTDPGGTQPLGSPNSVFIQDGSNNTVGGTKPATRNIVSGNDFGINITGAGSTGNKVQGNYIGTTKSGTGDLSNDDWGVIIGDGASNNTIGDDDPSDGLTNAANTIAFNGDTFNRDGVAIFDAGSTGNSILSNSIFSNANLGIDLGGGTEDSNGVTANDTGDGDTGPNNLQNYPVLTSAKTTKRATTIQGTLNSTANTTFTLQFFGSPEADDSLFGEGKTFRFQKSVTTDGSGNATFTFKTKKKVSKGRVVTATATNNTAGDTSEFSEALVVS